MTTDLKLSEVDFWLRPADERVAGFASLRALDQPVHFPDPEMPFIRTGPGFYALVRHADIVEASRNPDVFSSEPCSNSIVDIPPFLAQFFGSIINMDDPRHARLRRIVSRAFTPRVLAKMEQDLAHAASRIVDDLIAAGPGADFVTTVAARLPIMVICDMMGVPEGRREMVLDRTNTILGGFDPEYLGENIDFYATGARRQVTALKVLFRLYKAGLDLHRLAIELGRRRRRRPTDDLLSALVNADERLTDQELGSFFILLLVAGNETTRNALSHGLKLLTDNPVQRGLLLKDFDGRVGGAVEEIIRMGTPVIQFRRTLTRDHELNGLDLRKGDKVVLYYSSANRDESVFADPDAFDITRSPNPHVAFGGPGPHFCMGANLARREMTVMLRELFTRLPDLRASGEPDRLMSSFINGIKHLPCTF